MWNCNFEHNSENSWGKNVAEIPGIVAEIPGNVAEIPGENIHVTSGSMISVEWAQGSFDTMNFAKSFKSSSETLAYGLDLMGVPVNELVSRSMPDDPEEQQLLQQLKDWLCHVLYCYMFSSLDTLGKLIFSWRSWMDKFGTEKPHLLLELSPQNYFNFRRVLVSKTDNAQAAPHQDPPSSAPSWEASEEKPYWVGLKPLPR